MGSDLPKSFSAGEGQIYDKISFGVRKKSGIDENPIIIVGYKKNW